MKIAIIGAGFTGLAAAHRLVKKGHEVIIFEREAAPGGLAIGFKDSSWGWPLEKHYHHLFKSDRTIRELASRVGVKITFKDTASSIYINGGSSEFDSPSNLLKFPNLKPIGKVRVGITLLFLKITPFWKPLEKISAEKFLKGWMGKAAWEILWEPLFNRKFGKYYRNVPASWFWARIKKRSKLLGYPKGGFESLAKGIAVKIEKNGGIFYFNTSIVQIKKIRDLFFLKTDKGENFNCDKVICTLSSKIFMDMTMGLTKSYVNRLAKLEGLGAVNVVLVLKKPFLDRTYWLNINEPDFPFLGIMEQTNFVSPARYGGDRIVYIGNYLETSHGYFKKTAPELLAEFIPYLRRINPKFTKGWVKKAYVFRAPFAQPIVTLNYSKAIPPLKTSIKGLYLANIQQVYPWDRGVNYAVELGEKVAELIK